MQTTYRPAFEDWLFHVAVPLLAYAFALAFAALAAIPYAVFGVAAPALTLLFTGTQNAWYAVAV
jgi:hypothetical protein